jgi:drug/metabolite transporter (DMT)-like permease
MNAAPVLALVGAAAFWASALVGNKIVVADLSVSEVTASRFLLGAAFMWLLVLAFERRAALRGLKVAPLSAMGWGPVLMGAFEPGIAALFMVWGISLTSPVTATVMVGAMPILLPLLGRVVLREEIRPTIVFGAVLTMAGTVMLARGQMSHGGGTLTGDLLCATAIVLACLSQLLARRIAQTHGRPLVVTALQLSAAGLVGTVSLLVIEQPETYFGGATTDTWLMVLYLGVVCSALPFALYNFALRTVPVALSGLYLALIGPFGAAMSVAVFGTQVTAEDAFAIAIVVAGVALPTLIDARRNRQRRNRSTTTVPSERP